MKSLLIGILIVLIQTACMGTNTGNPGLNPSPVNGVATVAPGLAAVVCGRVASCFAAADVSACYSQVFSWSAYTNRLGARAAAYSTIGNLQAAEQAGAVHANTTNALTCEGAINQLSCSDTLMTQSYSTSNSNDYSMTSILFQSSPTCQSIF